MVPLAASTICDTGGGLCLISKSPIHKAHDCLHSTVRGARNLHAGHGVVNHMAEQVVVRKTMSKHSVKGVAVGQGILVFAKIY
jgi:hypothetical protein